MLECMNAKAHLLYLRIEIRALWREYKAANVATWKDTARS